MDEYRRRLDERYMALRLEISQGLMKVDREQYEELAGRVADVADKAVADLLVDVDLAEIDRDLAEMREVELALQRMKQGEYGLCMDCGETIPRGRLDSLPSAVRCLACQRRLEDSAHVVSSRSL